MSTKCIISRSMVKKPIQFLYMIGQEDNNGKPIIVDLMNPDIALKPKPKEFKRVYLESKNYFLGLDLIFAYDDHRSDGLAFIGMWNDGVVEP